MTKQFILLFWFIIEAVGVLACQTSSGVQVDTILCVNFQDGCGINYTIIQTAEMQDDQWIDSTRILTVSYGSKKAIIHLPIPDEGVKNFSIEGITQDYDGFSLTTSQGGGTCIIRRTFIFKVIHHQLFLGGIISEFGSFDSEDLAIETQTFHPKLKIDEIELMPFL